ncbi:MAG: hypothetical protein ACW98F_20210 [Candidatus Hodarchaeales archaeon]|jgi:hypothetical protein
MAITDSAKPGIVITTAAMNEDLVDQSQANGTDQVVVSDLITVVNNGQITTTSPFDTYPGRLCIINFGSGSAEEYRYITTEAAGTGNTRILTVHEPWTNSPVSLTGTIHVSYIMEDVKDNASVTKSSKTGIYTFSRRLTVGLGNAFAWLFTGDGTNIESVDNSSTTIADWTVANLGRWDNGYLFGGVPVAGGTSPVAVTSWEHIGADSDADHDWKRVKILRSTYQNLFSGSVIFEDSSIEGTNTPNETIQITANAAIDDLTIAKTNGFVSRDDASLETLTLRNTRFIGNLRNLLVYASKSWDIVNPTWVVTTGSQSEIVFSSSDPSEVNEFNSFTGSVQQSDGTVIISASSYFHEGFISGNLSNKLSTDDAGKIYDNILYRNFVSGAGNLETTEFGNYSNKAYKYPFVPFIGVTAIGSGALDSVVTLITDTEIAQADFDAAIFTGSGIVFTASSNPNWLLSFNSNSAGFSVGDIITGSITGASGTIVEVAESGALDGKLFLNNRNVTPFQENEPLNISAVITDAASASLPFQPFTWEVDGNSKSTQIIYEYMSAVFATSSLSLNSITEGGIIWGAGEHALMVQQVASEIRTERNVENGEGVYISNKGAGTTAYMTDNSGTQYVPPQSVTLTLQNVVSGSRCIIFDVSGSILMLEDAEGGDVTEPYTYVGDINITVRARKSSGPVKYLPFESAGTITSNGFTLSITQIEDDIAD